MDIKQKIQNYASELDTQKQREQSKDLAITQTQAVVEAIIKSIAFQIDDEKENPRHVVVDNTSDKTEVTNLDEVSDSVKESSNVITEELGGLRVTSEVQTNILSQVLEELKCLPKEHPEMPEPPETLTISNFPDHKEYFDSVVQAIKDSKINPVFDPKITVKASDVTVDFNHTPLIEALQALGTSIMTSAPTFDVKPLVEAQKATEQAVRDIVIPKPPNFIASFKNANNQGTSVVLTADGKIPVEAAIATPKYVTLIDETTTANITYIGKAVPTGADILTSTAAWQITRIDESVSPTTIKYADGDLSFNNTFTGLAAKNYY